MEKESSIVVKRDWKFLFRQYLRFITSSSSRLATFFKWGIYNFGLETFTLIGLYYTHMFLKEVRGVVETQMSSPAGFE